MLEDGVSKPLLFFDFVSIPDPVAPPASWMSRVSPDVTSNTHGSGRLFVMIMDDATFGKDLWALSGLKRITQSVIDKLGQTDLMAVVFTRDNRYAQNFTNDHAKLTAAVNHLQLGTAGMSKIPESIPGEGSGGSYATGHEFSPPPDADAYFKRSSVDVLSSTIAFLAGITDRRRAIFYVGVGAAGGAGEPPALLTMESSMADEVAKGAIGSSRNAGLRSAYAANIPVYAIDPCGLRALKNDCGGDLAFLQDIAHSTGGMAIVNTNDFEPGISQIFRENQSYYLLGYRTTYEKKTSYHRLQVKVNKPDVTVQTRRGLYLEDLQKSVDDAKMAAASREAALTQAISGLLPSADLPMQVTAAPFAQPGRKEARVAVVLGLRQPVPKQAEFAQVVETLELEARAFTPDGQGRGLSRQYADVRLRAGATGEFQFDVLSTIDLKPGRYELRLATYRPSLEKAGSVYADIVVPDFSGESLSLSGIVLTAVPAPYAAGKDALALLLPVTPTSAREFLPDTRVTAFFRVYQGGKTPVTPVAVAFKILNDHGEAILEQAQTIPAERFRGLRSADVYFDLPETPRIGSYVLTLDATSASGTARRELRYSVAAPPARNRGSR